MLDFFFRDLENAGYNGYGDRNQKNGGNFARA